MTLHRPINDPHLLMFVRAPLLFALAGLRWTCLRLCLGLGNRSFSAQVQVRPMREQLLLHILNPRLGRLRCGPSADHPVWDLCLHRYLRPVGLRPPLLLRRRRSNLLTCFYLRHQSEGRDQRRQIFTRNRLHISCARRSLPPHIPGSAPHPEPRLPSRDQFGNRLDRSRATRQGKLITIPIARSNGRDKRDPKDKRSPMPERAPPLPSRYADPLWGPSSAKHKCAGRLSVYEHSRKPSDKAAANNILQQPAKECNYHGVRLGAPTVPHRHQHPIAKNQRIRISWSTQAEKDVVIVQFVEIVCVINSIDPGQMPFLASFECTWYHNVGDGGSCNIPVAVTKCRDFYAALDPKENNRIHTIQFRNVNGYLSGTNDSVFHGQGHLIVPHEDYALWWILNSGFSSCDRLGRPYPWDVFDRGKCDWYVCIGC